MTLPRILLTAFEPFGSWSTNASALCLERVAPMLAGKCDLTTRIYPVEFDVARPLIEADLAGNFNLALHLGQARDTSRIRLEAIGLNFGAVLGQSEGATFSLEHDGPVAYHCSLPLTHWASQLRAEGFPAYVSYHAGTYLCNATLYWGLRFIERSRLNTDLCFVHVPLDISQVAGLSGDYMTLPVELTARAIQRLIGLWLNPE